MSILSGSHLTVVPKIVEIMKNKGCGGTPIIVGGIIPDDDHKVLKDSGVRAVYTPKDYSLNKIMEDQDAAIVKVFCSEMLNKVADDTVQIFGGMGLMEEMPIERLWRDSRLERIWDGTSEIQRHIITRSILRPIFSCW